MRKHSNDWMLAHLILMFAYLVGRAGARKCGWTHERACVLTPSENRQFVDGYVCCGHACVSVRRCSRFRHKTIHA